MQYLTIDYDGNIAKHNTLKEAVSYAESLLNKLGEPGYIVHRDFGDGVLVTLKEKLLHTVVATVVVTPETTKLGL